MFKRIHTYDLDGVLVDTAHRYRNLPNGSIDMAYWVANHTRENVAKDTLLPLAKQYAADCANPETYCVICTVRSAHPIDIEFIARYLGAPNKLLMVGEPHDTKVFSKDYVLKRRALQRIFNLKQFQNLPRRFWDDNIRVLDGCRDLFTESFLVQSKICEVIK